MVERLYPHTLVQEAPVLSSDALIHVLHCQANVMREVTVRLLQVDDPPPKVSYHIEARVSCSASFSPHIFQNASLLDFRRSIITILSLISLF